MKGATTVCETFECSPWLSQNMKMFGSMDKFFYNDLAGIRFTRPGYQHVLIRPQVVGDLRTVMASRQVVRGTISVEWTKGDTSLDLSVSIPPGMEGDINVPKLGLNNLVIAEGGKTLWQSNAYIPGVPGVTGATDAADWVVVHVGSGSYSFAMNGVLF
jgi:alpha-L-rhamnosidase